ncbi:MAG: UbiD family decarboxylase, partial [Planctomycetes bacterium]|nr:UbiD family decarboxylase [Planctomycetota bacterium]
MAHRSLSQCCRELERHGELRRIPIEVDPHLEMAEIHRRVHDAGGPALLFERVRGSRYPAVSNLFGTEARCHRIFAGTLETVKAIVRAKADPRQALANVGALLKTLPTALRSYPRRARSRHRTIELRDLPMIQSWPADGGPFITLPQVLTEEPGRSGPLTSNVGMYRIQLAGNDYDFGREVGLHFQIHRGIGVHYARAVERDERLPVNVYVGGPPAHTLAAIMPLPEGLSELLFAGMLGGRAFRYERRGPHLISTDADFVILGHVRPGRTRPEGPFGDHLGYYSLTHEFPVLEIDRVLARDDAIWPFTVVGRPPQEDSSFGRLIHEITGPMVPTVVPGLRAMHAVDEAGVHPLLLAVGSERYVPYQPRRPMELLTIANAVLGFGQASLAKYLWIAAGEDDPDIDVHDIATFLQHCLRRFDPERDLHFQTRSTIDTLDYSGSALHEGSKLVIAAAGPVRRELGSSLPTGTALPSGVRNARVALPGVLVIDGEAFASADREVTRIATLTRELETLPEVTNGFPLCVFCDDADFTARSLANFIWVTFTRSNPSHDVHGVFAFSEHKHWGCRGPL